MIKEFIKNTNIKTIISIMHINSGVLTSRILKDLDFSLDYLNILKQENLIVPITKGLYLDKTKENDQYFVLQLKYPNLVFSHFTALYLNKFQKDEPLIEVTIDKKYHNPNLKNINVHYTPNNLLNLGKTITQTPYGNYIYTYDLDKTICDLIKYRRNIEVNNLYNTLKKYIKNSNHDFSKLKTYAQSLNITRIVDTLVFTQFSCKKV